MKTLKCLLVGLLACLIASCSKEKVVLLLPDEVSNRMEFAEGQLKTALEQHGYEVAVVKEGENIPADVKTIRLEVSKQDSLAKEGFTITTKENVTTVCGNDGSGVIYGKSEAKRS